MRRFLVIPPLLFLLAAVTCGIYWQGLFGQFFFDDQANILESPGLRITDLSFESLASVWYGASAGPLGRPIAKISFALNYYLSGFDPFWFKLTNLGIHCLVGWFAFALLRRFLRASSVPSFSKRVGEASLVALLGAAIWLVHPLQLTSVLYVVQRMTSLSALFLLIGFWLHVRAREGAGGKWQMVVAWLVFWPLSCLSKENGVLFPLFIAAWEATLRRENAGRFDWPARLMIGGVLGAYLLATIIVFSQGEHGILAGYAQRSFTMTERLFTESRVLWFYVGLAVFPRLTSLGLYHDDIVLSAGIDSPWTTLVAILAWVMVLAAAWYCRRRQPLVSFGILWFLVGHSLESGFLPLEIAHEHRNYLSLLGLPLIAVGIFRSIPVWPEFARATGLCFAAYFAYCGMVTTLRAHQFANEVRRTQIEAQHHRESPRAQYEAGRILTHTPDAVDANSFTFSLAESHFKRATELDPGFRWGLLGQIGLQCRASHTAALEEPVAELTRRMRSGPIGPGETTILFATKEMSLPGRGACLAREQIEEVFQASMANPAMTPGVKARLLSWLADYYWHRELDWTAAMEKLNRSLAIVPANASNRLKLAQLLLIGGMPGEAARELDRIRDAVLSPEEAATFRQLDAALRPDRQR